jgi:hypothetical protein
MLDEVYSRTRKNTAHCPVCGLLIEVVQRQLNVAYRQLVGLPTNSSYVLLRPSVDIGGYFFDIYLDGLELGAVRCASKLSFHELLNSATNSQKGDDQMTSSRIKDWLHSCQQKHGESCRASIHVPSRRYNRACKLILIDTIEERLVLNQSSLDLRYVALSYVWGGVTALQTTSENIQHLQEPRSLNISNVKLPRTVRDAMTLVSSIGERYLWIDTLCIVQDDEENKKKYITEMDIVYHCAILTIVAMHGQDSNAGLPGLRADTRPAEIFAEIGDKVLLVTPPGLRGSADASRYERRGWTLQERILSRRCVYFSTTEVYFQCRVAVWREASLAQELLGFSHEFEPPSMMNPIELSRGGSIINAENAYQRLVENYTQRRLTYASDKLNAFRGLVNLFNRVDEHAHFSEVEHGIPTGFWNSLLWAPQKTIVLRSKPSDVNNPSPTWSWLAWEGPITYPVRGRIYGGRERTVAPFEIPFSSSIRANEFPKPRYMVDGNEISIPGSLLEYEGRICGVLFGWNSSLRGFWDNLRFVFHSYVEDDTESWVYDGAPPLKFRIGNYVHVMDKSVMNGRTVLVNVLVVKSVTYDRRVQRQAMAQISKDIWEKLVLVREGESVVLM